MNTISDSELSTVCGGESFGQVIRALPGAFDVPAGQTRQATIDFINDHPFFHQGVMDLPIGGGKHFRNVPFIGPGRVVGGVLSGNLDTIHKGIETTKGTWAAP